MQWVTVGFVLAITCLSVSAGRLADLVGRKRLMLVALVVFSTAGTFAGIAPTLGWLIAARAVQGFGAAVLTTTSLAIIASSVVGNTGRSMGLLGSMSAIGTAVGPALGGGLISCFGWRAIFFINVPLGLLTFAVLARHLPADHPRVRTSFDWLGTALLATAAAGYALAVTASDGEWGAGNVALLLVTLLAMTGFVLGQRRSRSPLVRLELLKHPELRANLAMTFLVAAVMMGTLVVGPFYLLRGLHLSAAMAGSALSLAPFAAALAAVPAGLLVDRFGTRRATVLGLSITLLGCLTLAAMQREWGLIGYVLPAVATTIGYALFQASNNAAVMRASCAHERGVVAGLVNLSRNLGLVTGASLLGAVFSSATQGVVSLDAAAVAFATRSAFIVVSILIIAALALAVRARPSSE